MASTHRQCASACTAQSSWCWLLNRKSSRLLQLPLQRLAGPGEGQALSSVDQEPWQLGEPLHAFASQHSFTFAKISFPDEERLLLWLLGAKRGACLHAAANHCFVFRKRYLTMRAGQPGLGAHPHPTPMRPLAENARACPVRVPLESSKMAAALRALSSSTVVPRVGRPSLGHPLPMASIGLPRAHGEQLSSLYGF